MRTGTLRYMHCMLCTGLQASPCADNTCIFARARPPQAQAMQGGHRQGIGAVPGEGLRSRNCHVEPCARAAWQWGIQASFESARVQVRKDGRACGITAFVRMQPSRVVRCTLLSAGRLPAHAQEDALLAYGIRACLWCPCMPWVPRPTSIVGLCMLQTCI